MQPLPKRDGVNATGNNVNMLGTTQSSSSPFLKQHLIPYQSKSSQWHDTLSFATTRVRTACVDGLTDRPALWLGVWLPHPSSTSPTTVNGACITLRGNDVELERVNDQLAEAGGSAKPETLQQAATTP